MSEPCERFDAAALERVEAGLPLDEHFSKCPECLRREAGYRRIFEGLRGISSEEPNPGWRGRVRAEIASRNPKGSRTRARVAGGLSVFLASAAALYLLVLHKAPPVARPTLAVTVTPGARGLRGQGTQVGDVIELEAHRGGARFGELRIYREDAELVFRCPDRRNSLNQRSTCSESNGVLVGSLSVPETGTYQPVLLTSGRAIPEPRGGFEADSTQLIQSGAIMTLGQSVRAY